MAQSQMPQIEILDRVAVEDLIGKVRHAATQPGIADEVGRWRAEHGDENATVEAHSFVVVGPTLMFLHKCPDGVILPFAAYPDGVLKVYADPDHAGESFLRRNAESPQAGSASSGNDAGPA